MKNEQGKDLISFHTFMFPFRWDMGRGKNKSSLFSTNAHCVSYQERLNVETFKTVLCATSPCRCTPAKPHWRYIPFEIKDARHYNEYTYFYPHARNALFNSHRAFKKGAVSYHFTYDDPEAQFYHIFLAARTINGSGPPAHDSPQDLRCLCDRFQVYSLAIETISLEIYDTGIGILQFDLENTRYQHPEDILKINDFGRRIYPPFLGDLSGTYPHRGVSASLYRVYPLCVHIGTDEAPDALPENCEKDLFHYENPVNLNPLQNKQVCILPGFIQRLLGRRFSTRPPETDEKEMVVVTPVIDDRMFTLCVYGDSLNGTGPFQEPLPEAAQDFWYKFLFVDGTCEGAANSTLERDLVTQHTYSRWIDYGTLYGISRYSFMVWLKGSLNDHTPKMILTHCRSMYCRMIHLALVQRASIIRFSEEIADISSLDKENLTKIRSLYRLYIKFSSRLYFTEVTAQEQGIEMYTMIQDQMQVRENLADLRHEIGELHAYADLTSEKKRAIHADRLTILATLFLIPSFITGLLGMNTFGDKFFGAYADIGMVSFLRSPTTGWIIYLLLTSMIILIVYYVGRILFFPGLFKKRR